MAKAQPLSPEEMAKAVADVTKRPAGPAPKPDAPTPKSSSNPGPAPKTKTVTRKGPRGTTTRTKVDAGSGTFVLLTLATGFTVVARLADPKVEYAEGKLAGSSRIIIGGVLMTATFLVAEQFAPQFTKPVAGVIFLTSLLVNGVPLGQALANAVNYTPTAATTGTPPLTSPTTNPPPPLSA